MTAPDAETGDPHAVAPLVGEADCALLVDLYQLTMLQAYAARGMAGTAVFEFFVRKLPPTRGFLLAAGLEQVLRFLEAFRFQPAELDWLRSSGKFDDAFVDALAALRFTGDVDAMPEGTAFFPDEPILRITAPLPQAQVIETRIVNLLHFQTLIAAKAARMVLAAPEMTLIDFGLRRAHGAEAGLLAARASYVAGFAGTATVLAERAFGVPSFGTMAHSFIQAHADETAAFESFAQAQPNNVVLLIDTYDTLDGARTVVRLAPKLRAAGIRVRAVRLDSGDLIELARQVRGILDAGGLQEVQIFASGGIDETSLQAMVAAGAPIGGCGIGTSLTTSGDAPSLDCAYKLQEYDGVARRKRSTGKATWPGRKQVYRQADAAGRFAGDVLTLADDVAEGTPLLQPVMCDGRRLTPAPALADVRAHAADQLTRLPEPLRRLEPSPYPVTVAPALQQLARDTDAWIENSRRRERAALAEGRTKG
jgi:nicotinate phosphoribosyltransferase